MHFRERPLVRFTTTSVPSIPFPSINPQSWVPSIDQWEKRKEKCSYPSIGRVAHLAPVDRQRENGGSLGRVREEGRGLPLRPLPLLPVRECDSLCDSRVGELIKKCPKTYKIIYAIFMKEPVEVNSRFILWLALVYGWIGHKWTDTKRKGSWPESGTVLCSI